MRSRPFRLLLALLTLLIASMLLMACGATSSAVPIKHPDLIECGGPLAQEVAQRAAAVAVKQVTAGANAEQLEPLLLAEIKAAAETQGLEFASCLVDKALNAYRSQHAALQPHYRTIAPMRDIEPTASVGFVPLERDPDHARPWHMLLAGARGVRS